MGDSEPVPFVPAIFPQPSPNGVRIGGKVAHKLIQFIQVIMSEVEMQAAQAAKAAADASQVAARAAVESQAAVIHLRQLAAYVNAHLELPKSPREKVSRLPHPPGF